jgi:predicted DNA repair protein MutK
MVEITMSKLIDKLTTEWQDTVNFVLGGWLVISPWILGYASQQVPTNNAVIVGGIIAVAAAAALYAFQVWEEWVNAALAAWLIVSPWVLGFSTVQTAAWNHYAIGVLVGVLALWSANVEHGSDSPMAKG